MENNNLNDDFCLQQKGKINDFKKNLAIFIVIMLVGFSIGGYLGFKNSKRLNNENSSLKEDNIQENNPIKEEKPVEDNNSLPKDNNEFITFVDINQVAEDKIIAKYDVALNNKKKRIQIVFECIKVEDVYFTIHGSFYVISNPEHQKDVYVYGVNYDFGEKEIKEVFNPEYLMKNFNLDNFIRIVGSDNKEYLIIRHGYDKNQYKNETEQQYFMTFNDNLSYVYPNVGDDYVDLPDIYNFRGLVEYFDQNYKFEENVNPWYVDKNNFCKNVTGCHSSFKIENDKIYVLLLADKDEDTEFETREKIDTLEERVYTINNGKYEYEIINSYKLSFIGEDLELDLDLGQ